MSKRIKAFDFNLKDFNGDYHKLSDYLGKKVVLYFYPKDNTSACTAQACSYKDNYQKFLDLDIVLIAISKDSPNSHKKFIDKFELPFLLLCDEDKSVCEKYGVLKEKSMYGKKYLGIERSSFIIDEKGYIIHEFRKVDAKKDCDNILKVLNENE